MNKEELKKDLEHYRNLVENILLSRKSTSELKKGDVFLWRSGLDDHFEIHVFHSDAGYGAKTYTDYNPEDGSSLLVNYSGICGVLNVPHEYATSQTSALKKEVEELKEKRFKKPETKQLVNLAILFNEGVLDKEKLSGMLAYAEFIIDRLHENGDIRIPSRFES